MRPKRSEGTTGLPQNGNRRDYMGLYYPESRFGGFTDVDGTVAFYTRVQSLVEAGSVVLDVGCGRGECTRKTPFASSGS